MVRFRGPSAIVMRTEMNTTELADKYALVSFEGPPTSGKTMLAGMFSRVFSRSLMLEPTGHMMSWFHEDRSERAFTTQVYFLAHRMTQAKATSRLIGDGEKVCQDYAIWKDLVYAKVFLNKKDYRIYSRLYELLEPLAPPPDLLVVLECSAEVVMARLRARRRKHEASLGAQDIRHISKATALLASKESCRKIVIDTTDFGIRFNSRSRDRLFQMMISEMLELE